MEVKVPGGARVRFEWLEPQHSTEPSGLNPQVWIQPAPTDVKGPDGGEAWPYAFPPQQTTERSALTPQV